MRSCTAGWPRATRGDGTALFAHIRGPIEMENMEAAQSRYATHLRFRVVK